MEENPFQPLHHQMAAAAALKLVIPFGASIRPSSLTFSSNNKTPTPRSFVSIRRRTTFPKIYALTSNDIKVGLSIEVDGAPWKVLEFLHVKPGKGAAFIRTKMRNYVTGNTVEKTFRAGSQIVAADVLKETKQFTYKDGTQHVFMDQSTFEEYRVTESEVGDKAKWLKEGMDCNLLFWNGNVIDVELPLTLKLTVVATDPGIKGDTKKGGGSKPATVETGAVVIVPLFTSVGDTVLVDSRTGEYLGRG